MIKFELKVISQIYYRFGADLKSTLKYLSITFILLSVTVETALAKSFLETNKGKVIINIGFRGCHWCNVLKNETLKYDEISKIINKNFNYVEVDKDESPLVVKELLKAAGIEQIDGYPTLLVFDESKKFRGSPRGFPSEFLKIDLLKIIDGRSISQNERMPKESEIQAGSTIDVWMKLYNQGWDHSNGGFDYIVKKPSAILIELLSIMFIDENNKEKRKEIQERLSFYLEKIYMGAIYDRIDGGLHRISEFGSWNHPHYEKILEDQLEFAKVLTTASHIFQNEKYKIWSDDILSFALKKYKLDNGFFGNSLSAFSPQEGEYYKYKVTDIEKILKKRELDEFKSQYIIGPNDNKNLGGVLYERTASFKKIDQNYFVISKLKELKKERIYPPLDERIFLGNQCLVASSLLNETNKDRIKILEDLIKKLEEIFQREKPLLHYYNGTDELNNFATLKDMNLCLEFLIGQYGYNGRIEESKIIKYIEKILKEKGEYLRSNNTSRFEDSIKISKMLNMILGDYEKKFNINYTKDNQPIDSKKLIASLESLLHYYYKKFQGLHFKIFYSKDRMLQEKRNAINSFNLPAKIESHQKADKDYVLICNERFCTRPLKSVEELKKNIIKYYREKT